MHRLPQRLFVHNNNRHQVSAAVALCRTAQHHPWDLVGPCPSYQCGSRHYYSTEPGKRPSFFGNLLDNIRQEYSKNKEMQDSLAKFREEAKKLEDSEALREARRKFQNIEGESAAKAGSSVIKDQFSGITSKIKESVEDLSKHEALKKASELTESLGERCIEVSFFPFFEKISWPFGLSENLCFSVLWICCFDFASLNPDPYWECGFRTQEQGN
jgi:hypothetical protein